MVRMSLQGFEVVGKLSVEASERLMKLLIAEIKAPQRTKGRASLATMLKSKKPIKVFEINDKDLKKFCEAAKKYGVMYHILKDKSDKDGKCDVMVRAEDAAKINRIFQRFNLGANNKAEIRATLDKKPKHIKLPKEKDKPVKTDTELLLDLIIGKPPQKEKNYTDNSNPFSARTEKSRLSEPTLKESFVFPQAEKDRSGTQTRDKDKRPSVKAQLKEIEKELQAKQTHHKTKTKTRQKGKSNNGRSR